MPQLHQPVDITRPIAALNRWVSRDEAITDPYAQIVGTEWSHSEFLRVQDRIHEARERLATAKTLQPNWDSYGAEPPNKRSRAVAVRILDVLQQKSIPPTRLVASAEGGIGIVFTDGDRYADIECLNSGEIMVAAYSGQQVPEVWEVEPTDDGISAALERIRVHIAA